MVPKLEKNKTIIGIINTTDRGIEDSYQPYLGVTITETLSWKTHITNVKNRANKTLGFIKRNLNSCPEKTKAQAYISLIRPTLEYGCAAWDYHRKFKLDCLEQVQRHAARFAMKTCYREEGCVTRA